jgi:GTPase SAR1 family protein
MSTYNVHVTIIGAAGSGRTSLCERAAKNVFPTAPASTSSNITFSLNFPQHKVSVSVVDTPALAPENESEIAKALRQTMAVFLCYDASHEDAASFSEVEHLFAFAQQHAPGHAPFFVVLTKMDAASSPQRTMQRADTFVSAHEGRVLSKIPTSAKAGAEGIVAAMQQLAEMVVARAHARGE